MRVSARRAETRELIPAVCLLKKLQSLIFKSLTPKNLKEVEKMTKARFAEAENRLFNRVFICMNCGSRLRSDLIKVREKKVKCRHCRSKQLRLIHKEHKV